MNETGKRARLKSRLGFLMLAAGCAVGLGNVWRFPFMVGQNGGAAFVLVYLAFLVLLGFPLLTAELAIGRAAKMGISGAMGALAARRRRFWSVVGKVIFAGNFLMMIYYSDVAGWLLKYSADYLRGSDPVGFSALLDDHAVCFTSLSVVVAVAAAICIAGVRNGVERATKFMMIALLAILGVLAVKSLTLPGARAGLRFYLSPDWAAFAAHPWRAVFGAMGQAFFTLSVGVGCMTIFGSYVGRERSLASETAWIIAIDTFVAFISGLVVFPACASYGLDVTSGPGLIFVALPKVFANMAGGHAWGFFFFLFLTLAALTTIIAEFECLVGGLVDELKCKRTLLAGNVAVAIAVFSLPTVLFKPVLGWEDFVFGQIWLPTGALLICIFITTKHGWGYDKFEGEASAGAGMRFPPAFGFIMKYIVPILILVTMAIGLAG